MAVGELSEIQDPVERAYRAWLAHEANIPEFNRTAVELRQATNRLTREQHDRFTEMIETTITDETENVGKNWL